MRTILALPMSGKRFMRVMRKGTSTVWPSGSLWCNPADETKTWSGRQPQWIKDALAADKPFDDFLIAK